MSALWRDGGLVACEHRSLSLATLLLLHHPQVMHFIRISFKHPTIAPSSCPAHLATFVPFPLLLITFLAAAAAQVHQRQVEPEDHHADAAPQAAQHPVRSLPRVQGALLEQFARLTVAVLSISRCLILLLHSITGLNPDRECRYLSVVSVVIVLRCVSNNFFQYAY